MSRWVAIPAVVLLMMILMVVPALAHEEDVSPGGGNAFGEHVSGMAPEHPKELGAEFGKCVSTMARTGTCPDHS